MTQRLSDHTGQDLCTGPETMISVRSCRIRLHCWSHCLYKWPCPSSVPSVFAVVLEEHPELVFHAHQFTTHAPESGILTQRIIMCRSRLCTTAHETKQMRWCSGVLTCRQYMQSSHSSTSEVRWVPLPCTSCPPCHTGLGVPVTCVERTFLWCLGRRETCLPWAALL